jgi:hypothetical protein
MPVTNGREGNRLHKVESAILSDLSVYKTGGGVDAAKPTRVGGLMSTQFDAIWGAGGLTETPELAQPIHAVAAA